jgi:uncharacterized membrane protein YphA (DoxX/SURF4 family)
MMAGKLGGLLAMLRILAGGALLYSGVSKLLDDEFLYGGLLHQLTELGKAFPFYQSLLIRFVELHQTAFAFAVAIGEILVGLSLLFGLLVSWGALGGVFLVVNFALATTAHNVPGMIAHQSALRDGESLPIPDFGDAPS